MCQISTIAAVARICPSTERRLPGPHLRLAMAIVLLGIAAQTSLKECDLAQIYLLSPFSSHGLSLFSTDTTESTLCQCLWGFPMQTPHETIPPTATYQMRLDGVRNKKQSQCVHSDGWKVKDTVPSSGAPETASVLRRVWLSRKSI